MPRVLFAEQLYTTGQTNSTELEAEPATLSDSVNLPSGACSGIAVLSAGDVKVSLSGGGTAVLTGLIAGQQLPINATRIWSTLTTVTPANIYALYPAGNL